MCIWCENNVKIAVGKWFSWVMQLSLNRHLCEAVWTRTISPKQMWNFKIRAGLVNTVLASSNQLMPTNVLKIILSVFKIPYTVSCLQLRNRTKTHLNLAAMILYEMVDRIARPWFTVVLVWMYILYVYFLFYIYYFFTAECAKFFVLSTLHYAHYHLPCTASTLSSNLRQRCSKCKYT